jgi:chloramphenicol-sensitive protein RarD
VVEASLGYFITPLVNVLLGVVVLKERLRRWQVASVGLAACGVGYLAYSAGSLPWVSLVLASTFGMYGLLRKIARADSVTGLTVETTLLAPLGVAYLVIQGTAGGLSFGHVSRETDVLLASAGVLTAVPLLWFATAARRLPLTTMGFLQYLAPSGQFVLGVTVFKEPFTPARVVAFGLIWTALAVYSVDALRAGRGPVDPG